MSILIIIYDLIHENLFQWTWHRNEYPTKNLKKINMNLLVSIHLKCISSGFAYASYLHLHPFWAADSLVLAEPILVSSGSVLDQQVDRLWDWLHQPEKRYLVLSIQVITVIINFFIQWQQNGSIKATKPADLAQDDTD